MASTYPPRNDIRGFAVRTRKNLEYIEQVFKNADDVHVITQLANSLLGLIVFPVAHAVVRERLRREVLDDLVKQGWPAIEITLGKRKTLWDLVRHLRNGAAHSRMYFSNNSRNIDEVTIRVEDGPDEKQINWRAIIPAKDLRTFCLKFVQLLDDIVG